MPALASSTSPLVETSIFTRWYFSVCANAEMLINKQIIAIILFMLILFLMSKCKGLTLRSKVNSVKCDEWLVLVVVST